MYCRKCGKEILDDSVFCEHCGAKIDLRNTQVEDNDSDKINEIENKPTDTSIDNENTKPENKKIGLIVAIVVGIMILIGYISYVNSPEYKLKQVQEMLHEDLQQ